MVQRVAHAKLNFALHVTGQRDDGYHLLDTIVTFAEFGDHIDLSRPSHPHGPVEVCVTGPFSKGLSYGAENLVTSATLLMREAVRRSGIDPEPVTVTLTKNLPLASGIGGGSADAAATLLALQEFWQSDVDLLKIASSLGSDVPMCLHSSPLRARGTGEEIKPLASAQSFAIVLVNPDVSVSTPEVFNAFDGRFQDAISGREISDFPTLEDLQSFRNDLEVPAMEIAPEIGNVRKALLQTGAELVRMSGSGATCFGVYPDIGEANSACLKISGKNPEWWCIATRTRVA